MAKSRQVIRQRDFSGGHMVASAKRRDDEAIVRAGARDLTNGRILPTGAVANRPGRSALYRHEGRTDQIRMSPTATYDFCFGENTLTIRNHATGAIVAGPQAGYSWVVSNTNLIVWARFGNDIVMTFAGFVPKIARWDGGTGWTFLDFAFDVTSGGQRRAPFYRIAPKGITLAPSGAGPGTVNITFSSDYLVAGMVTIRLRYQGRQLTIATVTSPTTGTATVHEKLLGGQRLTFAATPAWSIGDRLSQAASSQNPEVRGEVAALAATTADVILLTTNGFTTHNDGLITGPTASGNLTAQPISIAPPATTVWDEEAMNGFRGWARSVSVDQNRLIFADLPGVPDGISWSTIGLMTDHYIGSSIDDGFFELVPERSRVYHVMPGADEFVFTDKGVYFIPISTSNPLGPGSIDFRRIASAPASPVRPISTAQGLLYVAESLDAVVGLVGTGQTAQPYIARPASELHADLFVGVTCLAVAENTENLVYAVNGNGTLAVGRYQPGKEWVGWVPWTGAGAVYWASALGDSVLLSTDYGTFMLVELVTETQYLDAAVLVNSVPSAFTGGGTGSLWFFTGLDVDLMDGLKYLGRRTVTLGEIVTLPNDDFSAVTVKAGRAWSQAVEPFVPHAQGGQSVRQTIDPRQTYDIAVAVQESTGFTMWQYNFKTATWTQLKDNASAYRVGDNQDAAPPQREEVVLFKAAGTEHDPRYQLRKTTPGTLTVLEISDDIGA